jgi:hypothetical protein
MYRTTLATAALAVAASASLAGAKPTLDTFYVPAPDSPDRSTLAAAGFTGFESPDFTTGPLAGQNGWTGSIFTDGSPAVVESISTANPASGQQHLRLEDQPALANGNNTGVFSPTLATPSNFLSVDVNISNTGGADYRIQPQTPTTGSVTAIVVLNFEGDVLVLDSNGAGGFTFIDTGADWTPAVYQNVTIEVGSSSIVYSLDGAEIYTGSTITTGLIEEVFLASDNFQLLGETGDFDNVAVPEPAAAGLLAFASLGLLRRRRA